MKHPKGIVGTSMTRDKSLPPVDEQLLRDYPSMAKKINSRKKKKK